MEKFDLLERIAAGEQIRRTGADKPIATRAQRAASKALASGSTINDAAEIAGVKPATIRAYLRTPEGAHVLAWHVSQENRYVEAELCIEESLSSPEGNVSSANSSPILRGERSNPSIRRRERSNSPVRGESGIRNQDSQSLERLPDRGQTAVVGKIRKDKRGRLDIRETGAALLQSGIETATLSPKDQLQTGAALMKLAGDLNLGDANEEGSISRDDVRAAGRHIRTVIYHTLIAAIDRPITARRMLSGAASMLGKPDPLSR